MDEFSEDWAMYTTEANNAVAEMMHKVKSSLQTKPLPQVRELLHEGIKEVGKKYGEVYDSDVRETIITRMTNWACEVHELRPGIEIDYTYWRL